MQLLDSSADLIFDGHGGAAIKRHQFISPEFLDECRADRHARFAPMRMPDAVSVARIPVAVVDHWKRNGFNVFDKNVTSKDIVARLKREGLDAFITTGMSL